MACPAEGGKEMTGCRRSASLILAVLFLLMGCGRDKPPAHPPVQDSTDYRVEQPKLIGGVQRAVALEGRPAASFYRLTVIEDGIPWAFHLMVYDTLFIQEFCSAENIQICVAACNAWGECTDTVCSDVYEVKADTELVLLRTTTGTDYTWVKTPSNIGRASDLAAHIGLNTDPPTPCNTVSKWNPEAQGFITYTTIPVSQGDFSLSPGEPARVEVDQDCVWRVVSYNPKVEKWRWTSSR